MVSGLFDDGLVLFSSLLHHAAVQVLLRSLWYHGLIGSRWVAEIKRVKKIREMLSVFVFLLNKFYLPLGLWSGRQVSLA